MSLARQETAIDLFKTDAAKRVLVIDIALNAGLDLPCADNIIFACREPPRQPRLSTGRGKDPTSESEFTHCAGEHTAF
jgi:hypothetical protein